MISSSHCLSCILLKPQLKPTFLRQPARRLPSVIMVGREAEGWDLDSDRVDPDMIVLRKRIEEIRITDQSSSETSDWMEWEQEYYMTAYASDVYELVGWLQRLLMSSRPSLAIATVFLILISVPTSLAFLLHRLLVLSGSVLSALHVW